MTTATDRQALVERAERIASHQGCHGPFAENCYEYPDKVGDWCAPCVLGALSSLASSETQEERPVISPQFIVVDLHAEPENLNSPVESHDVYLSMGDVSLLVNIEAGAKFTWSFHVPGQPHNGGSRGEAQSSSLPRDCHGCKNGYPRIRRGVAYWHKGPSSAEYDRFCSAEQPPGEGEA